MCDQKTVRDDTATTPLTGIGFLNMDLFERMSFRGFDQKPMKNTVFLFKTFISAKPAFLE